LTALFISFPGDEEDVGGCLAAGRGFLHISARGDVEPCPFTPWSDTSLKVTSLRKALDSPLLTAIREHHEEFQETTGGCALWNRRDWVQSLLTPSQKD
jgi:MoaA/NifB/PqqE/SkfB family radical SAM enzyme